MDPRKNPFAPGAGVKPPEFVGREALMEAADIAFDRIANGMHDNSMMLLGLRGVGKTVLLNALHEQAKSKRFETVKFEVPDKSGGHLARLLVTTLSAVLRKLSIHATSDHVLAVAVSALRNFASAFRIEYEGFSFGATPTSADAASGDLEADLSDLLATVCMAAKARQRAIAIFIDEVQYLSKSELSALARALQNAAQQGHPLIVVGAGLPQIAALVGDAKSYAERLLVFHEVGPLSEEAARRALEEPAARQGVAFSTGALDQITEHTSRYPYFLQTWGKFSWEQASGTPITTDDIHHALPSITAFLDTSFFRVRYDRCTQFEQRYLRAMSELGPGPHRTGDIAQTFGVTSNQVAPVRRNLIESGMIYSQRHGETAFTVPLFDEFMKRAIPRLESHSPNRRRRT